MVFNSKQTSNNYTKLSLRDKKPHEQAGADLETLLDGGTIQKKSQNNIESGALFHLFIKTIEI